jgi:redox-sensitive bicupin YhaK (pirin superfamily)
MIILSQNTNLEETFLKPSQSRGLTRLDWLNSQHTFSFGEYHDPQWMQFGDLRVINQDEVAPQKGFGTHGHQDMEIISLVLEGQLQHRDSLGTGSIIQAGDVQRMTAGTGVQHSEFNPSPADPVHFLQIWIRPAQKGLEPSYEQQSYSADEFKNRWRLIASPEGREKSVTVHQDVALYKACLEPGALLSYVIEPNRIIWIQIICGQVALSQGESNVILTAGDGLGLKKSDLYQLKAIETTEILLFDLKATNAL